MPYFLLRRARKRYWMSCPSMAMPGRPGFTRNGIHFHSPFPIFPVAQPLSDLGCSKDNRLPYPIQSDHTSIWPELFMRPQVGWFLFNIHACQHVAVIASASYGTSGTNWPFLVQRLLSTPALLSWYSRDISPSCTYARENFGVFPVMAQLRSHTQRRIRDERIAADVQIASIIQIPT